MGSLVDPFRLDGFVIDGKYRVATVVGDGGFGVVYRGVHKGFGELIAIKCLKIPGELDDTEREALLEQLREEGRILHRLSKVTNGIVQALDVGAFQAPTGAWVPYLILEWLEGVPLSVLMKAHAKEGHILSPLAALDLLDPAARALAVAHEQKVAHRDVKPANLFVTEVSGKRVLKVLDFGIAKVLSEHHSKTGLFEATGTAPTAFTPRYGAPEQFNKKRGASGPWTDVFALALIYVELVTGKKALEGDDPTQLYVASADTASRPTARARGGDVSDAVEAVLERALAVEPRERWADMGIFWEALESAVRSDSPRIEGRASKPDARAPAADDAPGSKTSREPTAFGPTMPAESLRNRSGPAASSVVSASGSGAGKVDLPDDPMAETPAGAASRTEKATAIAVPPAPGERSKAEDRSFPFLWVAVGIFFIGVAFAGYTWSESGGPRATSSAQPSASASTKRTGGPRPTATPTASASASASASTASPATSASGAAPRFASTEGMVRIRAGSFMMGETAATTVSRDFWLDAQEVTLRQYRTCDEGCGAVDDTSPDIADWAPKCNATRGEADQPVNCVDHSSASAYCQQKGKRLPTEAEWELAARGPNGRPFPWGTKDPDCEDLCAGRNGDCSGKSVSTCTPGGNALDRTPEGVWDLGGNVAEWVADGFVESLGGGTDPRGGAGAKRTVRGGSFATPIGEAKASLREGYPAGTRHAMIGFRCALDVEPTPAPGGRAAP